LSTRLSPDGLYYWDGRAWVSTLSPDGRHRWDGTQWVATGGPVYLAHQPVRREPTPWTRPLQIAIVAWYSLAAAFALVSPLWLGSFMSDYMRRAFAQQQAANPSVEPPPPAFLDAMTQMTTWIVWITVFIGIAIAVVAIVGAVKRWAWTYYAILALLGLGLLSLPVNAVNFASGQMQLAGFPAWIYVESVVSAVVSALLFVWMLIAQVRFGPWAMRRVA
jgi:hypothetical protein